mmetsp:Transcript_14168/g.23460  ORF Transcript_14168/g.23460 Transcript_14168/m.23460 type:complete len:206 (-) Transcript_14168:1058-1675(-)
MKEVASLPMQTTLSFRIPHSTRPLMIPAKERSFNTLTMRMTLILKMAMALMSAALLLEHLSPQTPPIMDMAKALRLLFSICQLMVVLLLILLQLINLFSSQLSMPGRRSIPIAGARLLISTSKVKSTWILIILKRINSWLCLRREMMEITATTLWAVLAIPRMLLQWVRQNQAPAPALRSLDQLINLHTFHLLVLLLTKESSLMS